MNSIASPFSSDLDAISRIAFYYILNEPCSISPRWNDSGVSWDSRKVGYSRVLGFLQKIKTFMVTTILKFFGKKMVILLTESIRILVESTNYLSTPEGSSI